jgi:hypothetical protein
MRDSTSRIRSGRCRFRFLTGATDFSLLQNTQTSSAVHPPSCAVGMGGYYPGARRLGRDFDHFPPYSAKVKKECSHISTTLGLYAFMA